MYLIGYCYGLVILYVFDRACIMRLHATALHHEQHVVSKFNEKKSRENILFELSFYILYSIQICGTNICYVKHYHSHISRKTWILSNQISYHKIDNINLLFLYDHLCSLNKILFCVLPLADLCIEYILPIIEKIVVAQRIDG